MKTITFKRIFLTIMALLLSLGVGTLLLLSGGPDYAVESPPLIDKFAIKAWWADLTDDPNYRLHVKSEMSQLTPAEFSLLRAQAKNGSYYATVAGAGAIFNQPKQTFDIVVSPGEAKFWVTTTMAYPETRGWLLQGLITSACTPPLFEELAPLVRAWRPEEDESLMSKMMFMRTQSEYLFYCGKLGYDKGAPSFYVNGGSTEDFLEHWKKEEPRIIREGGWAPK